MVRDKAWYSRRKREGIGSPKRLKRMINTVQQIVKKKGKIYERQAYHCYLYWRSECIRLGLIEKQ